MCVSVSAVYSLHGVKGERRQCCVSMLKSRRWNFKLVMKQSKFNTDAPSLTYISKWDYWWGDYGLLFLSLQWLCSVSSEKQKCYETVYGTQTKRVNLFPSVIDPLFSFFSIYGWKQESVSLQIISIFVFVAGTGIVQISGVFLSLSSKTNAHTRQDLYGSK